MEDDEEEKKKANLESFLAWAAELRISDSPIHSQSNKASSCIGQSLHVSHFPDAGGRGLGAARDLRKGELILRVPKSALITRECLLKDHSLVIAVQKYPSLSSTQILVVGLLNEVGKGKSSLWYPYLVQLPLSYDILPSFGPFEIQALHVEDAIWATERARQKAQMEWKESNALMSDLNFKPQLQTFQAWLWSAATISSRTMHIPWDDAGCLCPVGDFFNYVAPGEDLFDSNDSISYKTASSLEVTSSGNGHAACLHGCQVSSTRLTDAGYEEDVDAYCFYSRRNYKQGEQVLLSYGTYTNLELLEHYGFLLDRNPNDKALINLEPEMLSLCSWPKDFLYIRQDGQPSFALLSTLRLWTIPASRRKSVAHIAYSGSQLSVESEIEVMRWLANNCSSTLKKFQTSIDLDRQLLCNIDKLQESPDSIEFEELVFPLRDELCAFMESNHLPVAEKGSNSKKFRNLRSINRWKLAVHWRLMYKKILAGCISHCTEAMESLSRQTGSSN